MASKWRQFFDVSTIRRDVDEIKELATTYVNQESIDPLKATGRYAAWGCAGSLFIGMGAMLALVGLLRVLQDETAVFHGTWSWVPYIIIALIGILIIALIAWRIVSGPAKRRLPAPEKKAS